MIKRREQTQIITGLDIGSTAIRVAVGQYTPQSDRDPSKLQIIGAVEVPSEGLQKGVIVSIEDTVSAISKALEQTERLTGLPVEHLWVGISGIQIIAQESRGVIAVGRSDGEISHDDVERAVEAARTVASPLNYEVLHVLPRSFRVDGQTNIKDPVGMTGIRMEVDTNIIYGLSSHLKNITKTVYRAGVDIDDFVLTILAASEAVLDTRQKELGVVVVNIGGPTTSVVVYEEGDVVHTSVIPIGSTHITNDLALGLKTSIDVAEQVKIRFGQCMTTGLTKKDQIDLFECGAQESEMVSAKYVSQIIEARVGEILEKVDDELMKIERSRLLPAGVVFIGGGSKIRLLTELAREELGLPASLGECSGIQGVTEKVADVSFVPVIGLVHWGMGLMHSVSNKRFAFNIGSKLNEKVQKIFKSLIP